MNVLESEFLEYQATPDDKFPAYFDKDDKPMSCALITFGTKYLHKLMYTLVNLVLNNFLLLISHSNLYCESIFSAIRKICTDARHNLRKDAAPGHQSISEYTEATSIRNNLLRILIPKINIFGKKKLACYEWEPTKSILAQAKSPTYKNLQARKKQQQQAAANENPEDYTLIIIFNYNF